MRIILRAFGENICVKRENGVIFTAKSVLGNKTVIREAKRAALVSIGTAGICLGVAVFLFPFGLVTGGISGLAIALESAIGGALGRDVIASLLVWACFILGALSLGRGFALKTMLSTLLYPPLLSLFSALVSDGVMGGYFVLGTGSGSSESIIAALFGGVFIGAGCALSFLGGGSSGGTDVFALVICKLYPKVKLSSAILATDALVILSGAAAIGDFTQTLLGILSALTAALTLERMLKNN